jgi:hypothetical protein
MGNLSVLSTWDFDVQQDFFKFVMKSNATQAMVKVDGKVNLIIVNPFIHLRQVIHQSHLLSHFFRIIKKLVEIAMVHVISFVEDECYFNSILFLETNCVIT